MNKKTVMVFMTLILLLLTACDGVAENAAPTSTATTTDMTQEHDAVSDQLETAFLPESIFQYGCYSGNEDLHIEQVDGNTIGYTDGIGNKTHVTVTEKQIAELRYLTETVADFTNLPYAADGGVDTVIKRTAKNIGFARYIRHRLNWSS